MFSKMYILINSFLFFLLEIKLNFCCFPYKTNEYDSDENLMGFFFFLLASHFIYGVYIYI